MKQEWQGKRVVIIGAARQGIALARYLARHHAIVVLNDKRTKEQLQSEIAVLADVQIEWAVGNNSPEILSPTPDVVFVSGGVPLDNPIILQAQKENIRLSNDTQIFMEAAPCKTIGITGSAGKTTTTTLLGRIARAGEGQIYRKVWIGGNIGDPLLNYVDEMQSSDLAILEISSFQSELMNISPNLAVILNITPNHLDRHKTMENYISAKANVMKYQKATDMTILGRDDPHAWQLSEKTNGRLFSFGFSPLQAGQNGSYIENGKFFIRNEGVITPLPVDDLIELRGEHNQLNTLAACTIAWAAGFSVENMQKGIKDFHGVPHRLEWIRNWNGTDWYNDSIATAPERTIAAIRSFDSRIILLLGGRDKDLPWNDLAQLVKERVDQVILFGEAAEKIHASLKLLPSAGRQIGITRVQKCCEVVEAAKQFCQPGYVVLFSPGGTSYDEFKDFEERGEKFKQWVLEL